MAIRHSRSAASARPLTRRLTQVVAAALVAAPLSVATPLAAHADGPPVTVSPDAAALAQAQATGKSVPVDADTTTNSTTVANPDGTFTYSASVAPTRVQQNGSWVPVDNTLAPSGGGFAPKAAASQVVFSGGGTGPLATLTNNAGQALSISWPNALPAPTVSGATATYANVYPGVDLQMTATTEGGYTEHLVVNNATAAANPALQNIHLATSASAGLTLSRTAADGVQATDAAGNVAFSSPTATMWSTPPSGSGSTSSARTLSAQSTSSSATPQDDGTPVTPLGVTVSGGSIDLTPPASALTGPNVTYPVVIDPGMAPGLTNWMWLSKNTGVNYWEGTNNTHDSYGHVGYDDWCSDGTSGCSGFGVTRSFFSFPTTALHGDHVTAATLTVTEQGPTSSWSGNKQIDLHGGGGFSSSTTWSTQSVDSSVAASAQFPSITTNTTQAPNFDVTALLQNAVTQGWNSQTMVLEANSESDDTAYRYIHGSPTLAVTFYEPPAVPTNLSMDESGSNPTSCNTTAPGTWLNSFSGGSINLNAYLPTPGSASNGTTEYGSFWYIRNTDTAWSNIHSGNITLQSTPQKVSVAMPAVSDGQRYKWQVYADNAINDNSTAAPSATTSCWFGVDLTPPSAPVIGTAQNPSGVGASGTLSVTASDGGTNPSGVAKIFYNDNGTSLTSGGDGEGSVASSGSVTSIPLKADHWGTNWVWIASQDAAGNMSQPVRYDLPYMQEAGYTPVAKTGDLDGDNKPDFAVIDVDGNIRVYSNPETINPNGTSGSPEGGAILIPAASAPNGSSFRGAIVAHNGSFSGQNCDDLVVIQQAQLAFEKNNYCAATPSNTPSLYPGVARPSTVTGDSTNYNANDWSSVQQAVVLPPTGSQTRPTLVTLENDNGVETVWAFTPSTSIGHFTTATLLATGSYWNNVTLISPGNIGTGPALWVRDNTTGSLTQYLNIESWAAVTGTPTGGTSLASSGYTATTYPLLTSDGAVDTSGAPALWAANSLGQLTQIPSTMNGTAVTLGSPAVVGTTGWSNTWMLASNGTDTTGGNPATVNSATTWTADHNLNAGAAAQFNGTTAYAQTTGPAIDTTRSYTVSAWVKPNSLTSSQDALSQGTNNHQAFYIGYDQAKGHWYYMNTTSEAPNTAYPEAAGGTATVGQWTHLTAVYDAGAGTMTLYVNGVQAATAADTTPVASTGALNIGANVLAGGGSPYNQFNGAVSDVETFPYALSTTQVSNLASGKPVLTN